MLRRFRKQRIGQEKASAAKFSERDIGVVASYELDEAEGESVEEREWRVEQDFLSYKAQKEN